MKRLLAALVLALVLALAATPAAAGSHSALAAPSATAAEAGAPRSEIFATSNTAIITDPQDPRLRTQLKAFEHQVDEIIDDGGADPGRSTLLNGVFWSATLGQTTYERSREFDVEHVTPPRLHDIAEVIRTRFHQESVLTFELLPRTSARVDAVEVEVPGLDVRRLHDGLVADPIARDHLSGGSVTLRGRLILVADLADLDLVHRFVVELGGDWALRTVRYGAHEFVG
jgi:hypothetical protein